MTRTEVLKRIAKLVQLLDAYPLPIQKSFVTSVYVDGQESVTPLPVGVIGKNTADVFVTRDTDAKKKILSAAPGKDQTPITAKKLFAAAGIGANHWSRTKLWELVEEGELASSKGGFRKAK